MGVRVLVVDDSPTIRKVVGSILESSSYVPLFAVDGQDALEVLGRENVDLVLVDFVMPRMNGYQFCRALRGRSDLSGTPVVLMSAKGDKIRGQFVQQTGALDAITKPFDARGLLAVVEAALRKRHRMPPADQSVSAESGGFNDAKQESLPPESAESSADPRERREKAASEFAKALAQLVVPELLVCPGVPADSGPQLVAGIARAVTADSMASLTSLLRTLDFGQNTTEVLAGDLSVISVPEVLQLLQLQRQSGALNVARRGAEVSMFLRNGMLDMAVGRGLEQEFRIGRYFVELGQATRAQVEEASSADMPNRLLGERLIALGLSSESGVRQALGRQTSELVYEVVRWKKGRFSFSVGGSQPAADQAGLKLNPGGLVIEGFRRVDEWRLIEGSFDFGDILYRDNAAIERFSENQELTTLEHRVIGAVDGERTIRDIVDEMAGSSFDVCKVVYQLLNSHLVRRKGA